MARTPDPPEAAREVVLAARALRDGLAPLARRKLEGVTVLSPLEYAWELHSSYLEKHVRKRVDALLVGMNPGPWGMGQTGVPFGDPGFVRGFLGLSGRVERPRAEHPRVAVLGLESPRAEVSGRRLWGGARRCFGSAGAFFRRFFVANYCPLLFLGASGANVTPDKLERAWLEPVFSLCDEHLLAVVRAIEPARVLGVGAWTAKRVERAVLAAKLDVPTGALLHPSPASPAANKGWLEAARGQLAALGCPWPEPSPEPG